MSHGKGLSRRDFIKTAGAMGSGSLLVGSRAFAQSGAPAPETPGADAGEIPTGPFGKTGIRVSCLSLGGMFDIPSNQLLLKQAVRWGVTYWDTADCYEGGRSEAGFGQFFKKYPETRGKVFLVTKSDERNPEGMTKLLQQSLERLNTDYIDLYFIHGTRSIKELNNDTRAWVEKAKKEGKIKLFGFSTHSNMEECMLGAAGLGWIDGIMMTYNFRIMHSDRMKAAVEACVKAGIGLTAMKTQGGGSVRMDSEAELALAGRFLKMGFTDKQAKLKAVWENPDIASICSQMPSLTVLMSNVAAALNRDKLSAPDLELLNRYALETSSGYCAGCADLCESAIDCRVPVGDVMRHLMYFHSYGERDRAREFFAGLDRDVKDRLREMDFKQAENKCPNHVRIGRLMKEASTLLA
ncbi:MAG TPA: aldo/keto reductase [Syntrophobacter fumaroxidans]|nr:aldo/keto reductase [Syntrophobacter fumaroxidans]